MKSTFRWVLLVGVLSCWSFGLEARGAPPATSDSSEEPKQRVERARKLYAKGRKAFNLGKFGHALDLFTKAYEKAQLPGFLYNIAQCHRFLGHYEKAIFFYQGYLRDNPGSPDRDLVRSLIERCRKAVANKEKRRKQADRLFKEASAAYKVGEFEKALTLYRQAYRKTPLPGYLYKIGQCHRFLGHYGKAIHAYEGYLKENPGTPKAGSVEKLIVKARRKQAEKQREKRLQEMKTEALLSGAASGKGGDKTAPPQPLYEKWWFWTIVAAGATALGVGLGVGLTRDSDQQDISLPSTSLGKMDWRK
jgi:tetratricopeptide (TPR) repeat protein